jgi:nitrogenase-associated protein
MAHVIFFEKPGCAGNARQKELLLRAGHTVEAHDLTAYPWSPGELMQYLGDLPVADWFNRASPRVKSRELDPDGLSPREALPLLLADPTLLRRPLMRVGERREVGFLAAVVDRWIGLEPVNATSCASSECGGGSTCASYGETVADAAVVHLGLGSAHR